MHLPDISPRLIAMGFPSKNCQAYYRNDLKDVIRYFRKMLCLILFFNLMIWEDLQVETFWSTNIILVFQCQIFWIFFRLRTKIKKILKFVGKFWDYLFDLFPKYIFLEFMLLLIIDIQVEDKTSSIFLEFLRYSVQLIVPESLLG